MARWFVLGALLLMACPDVSAGGGTSTTCKEAYAKCKLPSGPLGVCEPITCAEGPCFRCQGQH